MCTKDVHVPQLLGLIGRPHGQRVASIMNIVSSRGVTITTTRREHQHSPINREVSTILLRGGTSVWHVL